MEPSPPHRGRGHEAQEGTCSSCFLCLGQLPRPPLLSACWANGRPGSRLFPRPKGRNTSVEQLGPGSGVHGRKP